jgi:integrase
MMSPTPRLTDLAIRNLKPQAHRYEIPDPHSRALYVVVFPTGKKSFVCRFRFAGTQRKLTLQSGVSLAAARKLASHAMHEVALGNDPTEQKKEAKRKAKNAAANTLAAVCAEYTKRELGKLKSAKDRARYLNKIILPVLGSRQIDAIRRADLVRLLDKVEDQSGACTADAVLQILTRVFNWWSLRNEDFRSPIAKGMRRYSAAENSRERVLSDEEIGKIWTATEGGGCYEAFVRFLLLTSARRTEAAAMTWDEIKDGVWTLPASRSKTGVEIIRPLSKAALAIIAAQPKVGPCIFGIAGRPLTAFGRRKAAFDKKCGFSDWTQHDLRRTARTLLSRSGVDADTCERALGHALPAIRGTYDRHDYKAETLKAFEKLSALISNIVDPSDRVVMMKRKR